MDNIIKQSFKINTKLMRILGWYPPRNHSVLFTVKGYLVYFCFLVLVTTLTIVQILVEKRYDNMQVIYVSEALCYSLKLLSFLTNGQRIKKCIKYFNREDFTSRDDVEKNMLDATVKLCRRLTLVYVVGINFAAIMYLLPTLFSENYYIPLRIWLPYEYTNGAITYYCTVLYILVACMYAGYCASLVDPLIGGLAYQAVSQLEILKHRLQNLHSENSEISVYKKLIKCIQHHKAILEFVEEYEKCFSWVMFSQFLGSTFFICFCCIGLTTVSFGSVNGATYMTFSCLGSFQVLFYCYFGTLLKEENDSLITAIYMTQWYQYNVKIKKLLITLMERSKRPMIVTAEKLIEVTLETFVTIIKRSYSLVAVFK